MELKKKDYLKAMEILATNGWLKNELGCSGGPVCLLGALKWAAIGTGPSLDLLSEALGMNWIDVGAFNDAPDTTVEDVQIFLAFGAAGAFKELKR